MNSVQFGALQEGRNQGREELKLEIQKLIDEVAELRLTLSLVWKELLVYSGTPEMDEIRGIIEKTVVGGAR